MSNELLEMWTVTVTYKDGTVKVFYARDLDDFHWKMVPNITNQASSPMISVLIH